MAEVVDLLSSASDTPPDEALQPVVVVMWLKSKLTTLENEKDKTVALALLLVVLLLVVFMRVPSGNRLLKPSERNKPA